MDARDWEQIVAQDEDLDADNPFKMVPECFRVKDLMGRESLEVRRVAVTA